MRSAEDSEAEREDAAPLVTRRSPNAHVPEGSGWGRGGGTAGPRLRLCSPATFTARSRLAGCSVGSCGSKTLPFAVAAAAMATAAAEPGGSAAQARLCVSSERRLLSVEQTREPSGGGGFLFEAAGARRRTHGAGHGQKR